MSECRRLLTTAVASLGLSFLGVSNLNADQPKKPAADNTQSNKDQQTSKTADKAHNDESDRKIMQTIRRAVMDDETLSTNAHNVKIIAQNGKVTLKGPVNSNDEKRAIEQKSVAVVGSGKVTNELTVKQK